MTGRRPLRQMAQAAFNVVGIRLAGAAISLLTQVLLARLLLEEEVGAVFLTMSATSILALAATLGYPALALSVTARYRALGRPGLEQTFKRLVFRDTAVLTLAAWIIVAVIVNLIPIDQQLRLALSFAALSLVPADLLRLNSALANTERRFALSYMPDFVVRPGLLFAYLLLAWSAAWPLGAVHVLWAYTASNLIAAIGQALVLGRHGMTSGWGLRDSRLMRPMRQRALALAIVFATASAFSDIVTLAGGMFLAPHEVAVLGIVVRLAALAGFVTQALQQVVLPDLAEVLVRGDEASIRRLLMRVNILAIAAIAAMALAAAATGPLVLGLFGPEYAGGHWPLVLFMAGLTFRTLGGLNQHLLSLSGKQVKSAGASLAAVFLLLAGSAVLGPLLGIMGIAIAALAAEAAWAIALAWLAGRHAGRRGDILGLL